MPAGACARVEHPSSTLSVHAGGRGARRTVWIVEQISAPKPAVSGASCVTMRRPVFLTESRT
eukprot:6047661-Prymnesium_polylepis.1